MQDVICRAGKVKMAEKDAGVSMGNVLASGAAFSMMDVLFPPYLCHCHGSRIVQVMPRSGKDAIPTAIELTAARTSS